MPENPKVEFFSVFAVTVQKMMNIPQSFHDGLLPIFDDNQNFLVEISDHFNYRHWGLILWSI